MTAADLPALLGAIGTDAGAACGADADCNGGVEAADIEALVARLFAAAAPCGM